MTINALKKYCSSLFDNPSSIYFSMKMPSLFMFHEEFLLLSRQDNWPTFDFGRKALYYISRQLSIPMILLGQSNVEVKEGSKAENCPFFLSYRSRCRLLG